MTTQIYRKRKARGVRATTKCAECNKGIRHLDDYVELDKRPVHVYCTIEKVVDTCPECFTIGGQCACSIY